MVQKDQLPRDYMWDKHNLLIIKLRDKERAVSVLLICDMD